MRARVFTPKRILTLLLLVAAVGAAVWWVGYIPYDPLAIYRPLPANATLVGRHLRLPERWPDVLANPLAQALLRAAGVAPGWSAIGSAARGCASAPRWTPATSTPPRTSRIAARRRIGSPRWTGAGAG